MRNDHHTFTEGLDEIFLNVDLRPIRIFFEASDHILKNTLLTHHLVDKGVCRGKRIFHIPANGDPARCILGSGVVELGCAR